MSIDTRTAVAPDISRLGFTRRAWIAATPQEAYLLISDVSRVGLWSPNASNVAYEEGGGPRVGAWFTGQNVRDGNTWTTRSQVSEATPGEAFGFIVGGLDDGIVDWRWTFTPSGSGCEVRQQWRLRRHDPVLGDTPEALDQLSAYMADSVETTLVALSRWFGEAH